MKIILMIIQKENILNLKKYHNYIKLENQVYIFNYMNLEIKNMLILENIGIISQQRKE